MNWGRDWQLVQFGGASTDPQMLNKRGEMHNSVKTWLKIGGALDDQETADDLSAAEYKVRTDGKYCWKPKTILKTHRTLSGKGDALALTFAYPVTKDSQFKQNLSHGSVVVDNDYDPYA